ncbi:MAG: heavy-metal-associated domain-containing protein [Candidatus Scalinduaceae bacterium]
MLTNKYLNLGYISIIAIILGLAISTSYVNTAQAADEKKVELKIKGMGCEMCAKAIKTVISRCAGVEGCGVSYKEGKAIIEIEVGKAKAGEIIEAVEEAGYVPVGDIPEMY